jgi:hypothetical protein
MVNRDCTPAGFIAWLRQQHHRDDPVGDLARDEAADHSRQRRGRRLSHDYLDDVGADAGAHRALNEAVVEYFKSSTVA